MLGFTTIIALIGIVTLILSSAASISVDLEPENGTLSNCAKKITNATASATTAVQFGCQTTTASAWSDTNQPWVLKSGESVNDNVPSGVAIKNYSDFSNGGTRNFKDTMNAIRSAATAAYYVRLPAGTFHISDFSYGASGGRGAGYQDVSGTKYFGGLIGAGADKTFLVIDPNSMDATQLAAVSAGSPSPVQVYGIYAGSGNLPIPTIFSGITFRGNFQQSITLNGLATTPTPAPYVGLFMTSTKSGSFIQYCRFQGFGFAAKQSPPYETGTISSTRSNYILKRVEFDGRLAKEINSAQPVAAGGVMWNFEQNVSVVDSWLHHTRRSGWATHDHSPTEGTNANDNGVYYSENFQTENISDTTDGFAGTPLGFANSNVEEVNNSFTYVKPRFKINNSSLISAHIVIGTSFGNATADSISIADPIISDTVKGGCLIVRFIKTPNSLGTSPYYTNWQSGGFAALPIKVTRNGIALTPVLSTNYNASTHTPDKYYVVVMN